MSIKNKLLKIFSSIELADELYKRGFVVTTLQQWKIITKAILKQERSKNDHLPD